MRRVVINTGKIGLVFKRGDYMKVFTKGRYWMSAGSKVMQYDMGKPFYAPIALNILLKDSKLTENLHVVEVRDNEIALQYENGYFANVLASGRYAFWKGVNDYSFVKVNLNNIEISEEIELSVLQKPDVLRYVRVYVVESYENGLLMINGKFDRVLKPGVYYFWKNATPISVAKVDLRQLQLEVSGQEILTKDKAALRVNFYTQYKVVDIMKALNENKDYEKQLYILMQLALREFIGTLTLDEILERKESISRFVMDFLREKANVLGVEIRDCGVRDIILPGEVKEIMNQVLVAQKRAQANIIMRREETASTRSLLNTAKLMEENEMLFKLKEMEYVEKIADKINTISLSGGSQIVDQLKDIFVPSK